MARAQFMRDEFCARRSRGRLTLVDCDAGLPIGSGMAEAACKTLIAQRLKLSGMRWRHGAQPILTARGWAQSERFDEAWTLLAAHYEAEIHVLAQIIPFTPPKRAKARRR